MLLHTCICFQGSKSNLTGSRCCRKGPYYPLGWLLSFGGSSLLMLILPGPWPLIFLQSISAAGSYLQGTSRFMCLHSGREPTTSCGSSRRLYVLHFCSNTPHSQRRFRLEWADMLEKACLFRGKDTALKLIVYSTPFTCMCPFFFLYSMERATGQHSSRLFLSADNCDRDFSLALLLRFCHFRLNTACKLFNMLSVLKYIDRRWCVWSQLAT